MALVETWPVHMLCRVEQVTFHLCPSVKGPCTVIYSSVDARGWGMPCLFMAQPRTKGLFCPATRSFCVLWLFDKEQQDGSRVTTPTQTSDQWISFSCDRWNAKHPPTPHPACCTCGTRPVALLAPRDWHYGKE
jgi:hypothetical protein